jgi:cytochrome c551
MKKFFAFFGIMMLLALGTACGGTNNGNGTTNGNNNGGGGGGGGTAAAEQLYATNCQVCHGANLAGGVGPALTNVGSLYNDTAELKEKILKGSEVPNKTGASGVMTANLVSEEDAQKLAEWLMTKK